MNPTQKLLRIVPPEASTTGVTKAQGTKVLMPDGTPVSGVSEIVMTAKVDGAWEARITCHVTPVEMNLPTQVEVGKTLTWWRRLLLRAAGVTEARVTALDHTTYHRYERV